MVFEYFCYCYIVYLRPSQSTNRELSLTVGLEDQLLYGQVGVGCVRILHEYVEMQRAVDFIYHWIQNTDLLEWKVTRYFAKN